MFNSLGEPYRHSMSGISLRAWLAGMALTLGEGVWEGKGDEQFAEMAHSCVRIADAIIAELEK